MTKIKTCRLCENFMSKNTVVGIRKETKNVWERRCPLTPRHVRSIVEHGGTVVVESSMTRCFTDQEFIGAGAKVVNDLYAPEHKVEVVLGVKQIPVKKLPVDRIPRTFLFFSHTFKNQEWNRGRFAAYADAGMNLIDYELIKTVPGGSVRAMKYGPYAGIVGAIDGLHALGVTLLEQGYGTPFDKIGRAWQYKNIEDAHYAIECAGRKIREEGLPAEICPLTFVVTSFGDVSSGARSVIEHLPHRYVEPEELRAEVEKPPSEVERHCLIFCVATHKHMVERIDGAPLDKEVYKAADAQTIAREYKPIFAEQYAPYTSVLLNCMYWEAKFPRIISAKEADTCCKRMLLLDDITCDPCGSVEFFVKDVPINNAYYTVQLKKFGDEAAVVTASGEEPTVHEWKCVHDGYPNPRDEFLHPVLVYGADHAPAELPRDASEFFADRLYPYVLKYLTHHDPTQNFPFLDLPPNFNEAVQLEHGRLTPQFSESAKYDLRDYLAGGYSTEWKQKNDTDFC